MFCRFTFLVLFWCLTHFWFSLKLMCQLSKQSTGNREDVATLYTGEQSQPVLGSQWRHRKPIGGSLVVNEAVHTKTPQLHFSARTEHQHGKGPESPPGIFFMWGNWGLEKGSVVQDFLRVSRLNWDRNRALPGTLHCPRCRHSLWPQPQFVRKLGVQKNHPESALKIQWFLFRSPGSGTQNPVFRDSSAILMLFRPCLEKQCVLFWTSKGLV